MSDLSPTTLGPNHLSNNKTFEIQRTNHFEVSIDGLGIEVTLCVDTCPLPNISNEATELAYGNSSVKVAGRATYDDIEIVIKDAIRADIEAKLWEWRKRVYDPETDKIGWAADYKRDGTIFQYAPDGTMVRIWKIKGIWPTNMNPGSMDYSGSDKKTVSMTLAVDKAYPVRNR